MGEQFDHVIVGAGPAGCVLADRLSADPRTRVLLLEAGGPRPERHAELRVPVLFPRMFGNDDVDWSYRTEPQAQLHGRRIPIPRGKAVGGSSAINAQLWTRGHRADYDGWAAEGLTGWSYGETLPYFERAEERMRMAGMRYPAPVTAGFLAAAAQAGHAPAAETQEGYAPARATHRDGLRFSSADAYLRPALHRDNLTLRTGGLVRRVLFDGTRAVGVEWEQDGRMEQVLASEVVLAAGTVGSPHLLMLSGVGGRAELERHGIAVVHDAPNVGRNLTDHLIVPLAFRARGFTSPGVSEGEEEIERYLGDRSGGLGSILSEALLFLRTEEGLRAPDVEIVHLVVPYGEHGGAHNDGAAHGMALGVIVMRPKSRGAVTLASADPHQAPLLDPAYLSDPDGHDLRTAVAGVRRAQEIARMPGLAEWLAEPMDEDVLSSDEARITAYIRGQGSSIHHLVSTCRMGADAGSVVDPLFRVRGTEGLRVVDASAMPSIVRAHTQAPVTMLAEKAADLIARRT